jgi:lipid-binding SYLF domain-containing protein
MRKNIAGCMVAGVALVGALAVQANDEVTSGGLKEKDLKVLSQAPEVLRSLTSAPDKAIPENLLAKAECVLVFPNVAKGAFVVGGEHGRGVATCRDKAGGEMGAPAMFTIGGASVGWQIGGSSTDLVLLVMDRNGMNNLLRDEFKIGGEGTVAAGPVGRTAEASTDLLLGAQMLAWSRTQGLFAGVSLEGSVIQPNKDANERLYGRPIDAREIFDQHPPIPAASRDFVALASSVTGAGTTSSDTYQARTTGDTGMGHQRVTGTIVSVTDDRATLDTASGQRTFTLSSTTTQPTDLRAGQRVTIEHGNDLVATRITADGELPRTASPLPLLALGGVLSLFAAWRIRARRA